MAQTDAAPFSAPGTADTARSTGLHGNCNCNCNCNFNGNGNGNCNCNCNCNCNGNGNCRYACLQRQLQPAHRATSTQTVIAPSAYPETLDHVPFLADRGATPSGPSTQPIVPMATSRKPGKPRTACASPFTAFRHFPPISR
ncbi:hypothetical protein ABC383_27580 [Noviherbaspirillum sp. 1P10PC]|uniref:hypothetical protein n=1 Tax=Noviherbaspirillum sp. 1P10PC TaxID=3132292 RepID=UPI0039A00CA3